jgi:hypothetical protein
VTEHVILKRWKNETSETFWNWAEAERDDAPAVLHPLIDGERTVETTPAEAEKGLEWARGQIGWAHSNPEPIYIFEPSKS